jgi:hypothetical protein
MGFPDVCPQPLTPALSPFPRGEGDQSSPIGFGLRIDRGNGGPRLQKQPGQSVDASVRRMVPLSPLQRGEGRGEGRG